MLSRLLTLAAVMLVLSLIGQQIADKHSNDNESFRKLFHVMHGLALAGLAFVVPLSWIVILEIVFFVSVLITRYLVENKNHFLRLVSYMSRAYKVGRLSYGEFFYPVSVILIVLMAQTKWEFATSVLILGLADTAAAIIGKKYGKRTTYLILGQKKSAAGSAAFFVITVIIIAGFVSLAPQVSTVGLIFVLPIALLITLTENVGVYGTDNLLIPIASVLLLNAM